MDEKLKATPFWFHFDYLIYNNYIIDQYQLYCDVWAPLTLGSI